MAPQGEVLLDRMGGEFEMKNYAEYNRERHTAQYFFDNMPGACG